MNSILIYERFLDEYPGGWSSCLFSAQYLQAIAESAYENVELPREHRPQVGTGQADFRREITPRAVGIAGQAAMSCDPDTTAMSVYLNIPDLVVDEAIRGRQKPNVVMLADRTKRIRRPGLLW